MKKLGIGVLVSLTSIVLAYIVNITILQSILFPDPCFVHTHSDGENFLFFYEYTASNGYHPSPTTLNLIVTDIIWYLLGELALKMYYKLNSD